MNAYLYSTVIPLLFGIGSLFVCGLAWASGRHVCQMVALILLYAWAATQIAAGMGLSNENLMLPTIDAIAAICVASVGGRKFPPVAVVVFALYLAVGAMHVGFRFAHMENTNTYYSTLGYLFLAQLLTVGIASARLALVRWSAAGHKRPRLDPARR